MLRTSGIKILRGNVLCCVRWGCGGGKKRAWQLFGWFIKFRHFAFGLAPHLEPKHKMFGFNARLLSKTAFLCAAFSIEVRFLLDFETLRLLKEATDQSCLGISFNSVEYKAGIPPSWMDLPRMLYVCGVQFFQVIPDTNSPQ